LSKQNKKAILKISEEKSKTIEKLKNLSLRYMFIGVPKEIKEEEYRVGLTPNGAKALIAAGHKVFVESKAGDGSGFPDEEYKAAGAETFSSAKEIWQKSEMIIKVKEPQESEFNFLKPDLILFTYLHLAAFPKLTKVLQKQEVTAIDYATVELEDGSLPLLKPMSEVAGKLAIQIGAHFLEKKHGGRGILLGGTEKTTPANVLIIGAGNVGSNAAEVALGMGAQVTLVDRNATKLEFLKGKFSQYAERLSILLSSDINFEKAITQTHLLVGAVLVAGDKAPKVVTEEQVKKMKKGSVIVDVAIDQGGCIETSRPTSHNDPVFIKHGVIHYCVPNMPGIVPRTSTLALTQETLPYALEIANKGFIAAAKENSALTRGVNVYKGKITYQRLAEIAGEKFTALDNLL
jgi:alanine dehydrogenase